MRVIKTVLADDHRIFTEGLKAVLQNGTTEMQFDITGVVHNGMEAVKLLRRKMVDLLILDLNLPEKDGLEVISQLRTEKIKVKILALSMYDEPKIVKSAFKSGIDGYILKNKGISELFIAIEKLLSGLTYLGEGVNLNRNMISPLQHSRPKKVFQIEDRFIKKHNLTKRELEILRLITQALSNKEIAKELFISDQTVGVHRKNIMRKLGVSNTAGLLKVAYDNCLV